MYSGILTIVETSFSGLGGSGARQTSALDEDAPDVIVTPPSHELDDIGEPEVRGELLHLIEHLAIADEHRLPIVWAQSAQRREGFQAVVDVS